MKRNRLIVILLIFIMVFGVVGGCSKDSKYGSNVPDFGNSGGKDKPDLNETGSYILKNGTTEYSIVIPQNATEKESLAAAEFMGFFFESTGVTINKKEDAAVSYSDEAKIISIGKTKALSQAGIELTENLNNTGFDIKTKGGSIFIAGKTDRGTLYGIYELLSFLLDYEYFYDDTYRLKKNVKDLPLYDFDITDQADFQYNESDNMYIQNYDRFRMTRRSALTIPINGKTGHNAFAYFPVETYGESDWEFYSADKGNLSFTANGNPEKLERMYQIVLEEMIKGIKAYPNREFVPFIMMDKWSACTHASSLAIKTKHYNADSAALIIFLNEVRSRLDAWFKDTSAEGGSDYNSEVKILFYAYFNFLKAPVQLNKTTGEYEVAGDEVILKNGIVPLVAPIDADYTKPLSAEVNKEYAEIIRSWHAVSPEVFLYAYDANYNYYMMPYNAFGALKATYQFSKENSISYMFQHGQPSQSGHPTGFATFKDYLKSKFGWDVNADYNQLADDFFNNYFLDAAKPMRKFFDEYRIHAVNLESQGKYNGAKNIWTSCVKSEWYEKPVLEQWLSYTDEALSLIEKYRDSDPVLYKRLVKHIGGERLFLQYALVELYGAKIHANKLLDIKLDYKYYVNTYGTSNLKSTGLTAELLDKWGV